MTALPPPCPLGLPFESRVVTVSLAQKQLVDTYHESRHKSMEQTVVVFAGTRQHKEIVASLGSLSEPG